MTVRALSEVRVGDAIGPVTVPVSRETLVAYADASGDQNRIHQDEEFARSVGLPDVIAHGMLTMAVAGRVVTDWAGDPGAVVAYSVRFARPVPVPDDDEGTLVRVEARVVEKLDGQRVRVAILASVAGPDGEPVGVIKDAVAVVQL
jgi:acyl dehydratase